MLTGQPIPGTSIYEITFSGALTADEFEAMRDDFVAFLDTHDPADLLATYTDIDLKKMEAKALWEDLQSAGLEKRVRRAALVTDVKWLSAMATLASAFAKIDVRSFDLDDREAALTWLTS